MSIIRKKTKTGEIKYLVRVMDSNRNWYPSKTFDRKIDAETYEAQLKTERAKGAKVLPGSNFCLKEYWEKWKIERRTEISISWKNHQAYFFRDYIEPYFGQKELNEIEKSDISRLMGTLKDKGLKNSTRLHVYNLLNLMFRDAVEFYEILHSNPVRKDHRPKIGEVRRNFLKPEEARRFLKAVLNHRFGVAYWIMLGSGLRIGEVQGLKHKDLDLDLGLIHLKRQWNEREQRLSSLKNNTETVVQMPVPLVKFLKEKFPNPVSPDQFVVTSNTGNMADAKKIRGNLKRACKEAGIKEITPHELRHSCTELWIEMGASEEDLRRLLNHKSSASTRKYIHRTPERLSRLAAQINMTEDLSEKIVSIKRNS
jgi:integrase